MLEGLRSKVYASRLYDVSLGRAPVKILGHGPSLWKQPVVGSPTEDDFQWLEALSDDPSTSEAAAARHRALNWLDTNHRWNRDSWRADRIGDRSTFLLTHFSALCTNAPGEDRARLATALGRQARHLYRTPVPGRELTDSFKLWRGRIFCALYLAPHRRRLGKAVEDLVNGISDQIYPDGGHFARSPARLLDTLATIVHIRMALIEAKVEVPEILLNSIDRMAPMLRALRHGDGHLAAFNGSAPGNKEALDHILELSGSRAKAAASAPHSGFHRMSAHRTALIFDVGAPVDANPLVPGHAGTLSFEMSVGPHRLVVNCGNFSGAGSPDLREALRATAAHSTVTVADVHSSDLIPNAGFGERRAQAVTVRRREQDRNVLVEASHDGYAKVFGLQHRRALFLARDGLDLRGEDVLVADSGTGRTFDIRFHLHPDVTAALSEGGKTALLRLPTGRGWRLSTSDGRLALEESLYVEGNKPRNTTQLVLHGRHARRQTTIKWRLARE